LDDQERRKDKPDAVTEGILDGVKYTVDDFLNTTKPFEAVYSYREDPFKEGVFLERMAAFAKTLKVNSFRKMYGTYVKSMKLMGGVNKPDNVTQFDEQDIELITGDWIADEDGVWKYGVYNSVEVACPHPIIPVERLKNIDTGELKVKVRYRRGEKGKRPWNEITVDFDTLSNSKNITALSKVGISVTSGKRAQSMVDYLTDVMDLNYDAIPEIKSISRMGWNEEGFSPYVEGVVFDGNPGFARTFEAIRARGKYEKWLEAAKAARNYSVTARIVLAASFAAPLVKPLGAMPFFVHLWGVDSGTGKTVAQMIGASVWGDPQVGGPLFPTFRSTSVGFEVIAGFFNNLPVFIDELQLAKDGRGKTIFNVYELAAGAGKLRSNRSLGLAVTPTWANCFVTSGESTIVMENDGSGAVNRVIEIECRAEEKVIEDGRTLAALVRANYGHAGKVFVEWLSKEENLAIAKEVHDACYAECLNKNATEKQALAAALIVTADYFATTLIFQDSKGLTVDEMAGFMKTNEQVSAGVRGYDYMCGWVSQNAGRFIERDEVIAMNETLGALKDGYACIIRTVFDKACADAGLSSKALLSYLRSNNLIRTTKGKLTKSMRIHRIATECVCMKLPDDEQEFTEIPNEQLPFDL